MVVEEKELTKEEEIIKDRTNKINKNLMNVQLIIKEIDKKIEEGIEKEWIEGKKIRAGVLIKLAGKGMENFKEKLEEECEVNEKYFEIIINKVMQVKDKINRLIASHLNLPVNQAILRNELETIQNDLFDIRRWVMTNKGNIIE